MTPDGRDSLAGVLDGSERPRLERLAAVLGLGRETRILAIGWATVDRERTLEVLGTDAVDAGRDAVLGASAARVEGADGAVVVLEPVTEGPLAAYLARHGEGVCVLYVEADAGGAPEGTTALGVAGRLRRPSARYGPFVVEVTSAPD